MVDRLQSRDVTHLAIEQLNASNDRFAALLPLHQDLFQHAAFGVGESDAEELGNGGGDIQIGRQWVRSIMAVQTVPRPEAQGFRR